MPKTQFDSYKINITHGTWATAQISCYMNNTYKGTITFMNGTINEPVVNGNGTMLLYYPSEYFDSIYAVCKEESPVYLEIWGSSDKYCRLTTNAEAVGEEEGN